MEAHRVQQAATGEVDVRVRIANLRYFLQDWRYDLSKSGDCPEVLVIGAYLLAEFYQEFSPGVLGAKNAVAETVDWSAGRQLRAHEGLDLIGVRGPYPLDELKAGLVGASVQRPRQRVHGAGDRGVYRGAAAGNGFTGEGREVAAAVVHVQYEEESQHALHPLGLGALGAQHVDEVLDQPEFGLAWPEFSRLAPSEQKDPGHQLRHPSDEVHRVGPCVSGGVSGAQRHNPDC